MISLSYVYWGMQANILRELNATSAMEISGLDYDKVLSAYENVNAEFFYTVEEVHALPILAHAVHDMSSQEMILRQSAFRLLLSFVEFSGEILNGSLESNETWSRASIQPIVNNFLLKHMGNAMNKEGAVKKVLEFIFSLLLSTSISFLSWFLLSNASSQLQVCPRVLFVLFRYIKRIY